jgi:hypothetical protein
MHGIASPDEMLRAGVGSVEHFLAYPPFDWMSAEDRIGLFGRMNRSRMFLSTTLSNIDGSILVPYDQGKRRLDHVSGAVAPLRKYVCGYMVQDWREQVEERKDGMYADVRKMLPGLYRDVREMREAGVRTIAGTDVGVPFMYPGFSLHEELASWWSMRHSRRWMRFVQLRTTRPRFMDLRRRSARLRRASGGLGPA